MTQTQEPEIATLAVGRPVLLVGQPNVGKSALFGALTGRHATVSNYPGTTVTVSRGSFAVGPDLRLELIDTPGAYSLMPVTDEERVARNAMFQAPAAAVLHVIEATNLDRALVNSERNGEVSRGQAPHRLTQYLRFPPRWPPRL